MVSGSCQLEWESTPANVRALRVYCVTSYMSSFFLINRAALATINADGNELGWSRDVKNMGAVTAVDA